MQYGNICFVCYRCCPSGGIAAHSSAKLDINIDNFRMYFKYLNVIFIYTHHPGEKQPMSQPPG